MTSRVTAERHAPLRQQLCKILPAFLALAALFAAWEVYVRLSGISPTTLPSPSLVLSQTWQYRQALFDNALPTLRATLSGFALSLAAAFVLSILVDFFKPLRRALFPIFIISQTLPLVAIAPLIVLWFGFGLLPKILLVALVTFFPMLVALAEGYAATDREIERLLQTMGASRWMRFRLARLPSALPYFFAGLRISITYAVVGAIFAEYAGAAKGLGIYILNAKNNFRPDLVLAAVFVSSVLTLLLFGATLLIQRLVMPWAEKPPEGGQ
ncbi:ABC transporter permease [Neorhizobium alkalisoli]|uniref:ABC-type nitrate/sulfonate/bicarbonate transport system permease component n=1 Tax=Neorhizobium alkalisoli TaxID=528178 RepID=A0A561QPE9_9HYPH|nr:ABC transporter permease [Neorhizobium alkalisoli]TWF52263.1 ABC-type nitrate/sulfonate/bicarbonate transport system permease component [Neorhizobium alkalisoli]